MLRLSDFLTCRKKFNNQSGGGLYLSSRTLQGDEILNIPSSDSKKQNLFIIVTVE